MSEIILSINAGSSSVKISVYTSSSSSTTSSTPTPSLLATAEISGLTSPPAKLKYTLSNKNSTSKSSPLTKDLENINSQEDAFRYILDHLTNDAGLPELKNKEDIHYTCHRVVHGGDYSKSQIIDDETYERIQSLSDLAPLHNTPALSIIKSVSTLLPHATNIAYFDSAFHATIPEHIYTYPIDQTIARKNKLRKYGFHGISYEFIVGAVSDYLQKDRKNINIIALHLGSGASCCCISSGESHDTTMGLTPLSGLPGATRSGDIDPSLIFHFTHSAGKPSRESSSQLHITEAEEILNKQSGWKSLTGTTDFGAISDGKKEEEELAFKIFVDRILGYVGAYYVKLGGRVDALVFAGGIGEKGVRLRREVAGGLACLGFEIDEGRNGDVGDGVVVDVGREGKTPRTLVCRTDEQVQMARGVLGDRERFGRGRGK